ncbi:GNAT family N-acetyltransferase [Sphingomonas carotinifaciens]|uniref:GNAT family N-acetyltransferase n=1 Tax=Sphingomonas carotinifaciens TaxID=1166323 RepID=UPI001F07A9A3|nr:GNAT family N-acetyltransferase [Sphingomonas carotinifaciens]
MTATRVRLKFQVGARTLAGVSRRLERLPLGLDAVLSGEIPALPPIGAADGYLVTSLPAALLDGLTGAWPLTAVRQRYTRHHVDLARGHEAWMAGLSGQARSGLRRKTKRLGGTVRGYRSAAEVGAFLDLAIPLAARTYQARHGLDAALSDDPAFQRGIVQAAGEDRVRAWAMFVGERPIAYLCCTGQGRALRYDHVGHDPDFADRSPGTVLMAEALADLFGDRFAWFDFLEGDGQHKRQFATGGTECLDLLMLRPTIANRVVLAALGGFEGGVALARRGLAASPLRGWMRTLRR